MLGMKKYDQSYIDACRARVEADLQEYREQVAGAPNKEFESRFFNAQVLLLDHMFVHRLTGIEGKDGNPLNEVRVLCDSLLFNGGKVQIGKLPGWPMSAGSGIKLSPEKSLLGLTQGDEVKLTEAEFVRLSEGFFNEMEKRYR